MWRRATGCVLQAGLRTAPTRKLDIGISVHSLTFVSLQDAFVAGRASIAHAIGAIVHSFCPRQELSRVPLLSQQALRRAAGHLEQGT